MSENKFQSRLSLKTNVLNWFRKVLTIPLVDNIISGRSSKNPTKLWQKIVPPEYLYAVGSIRKVEREGVKFVLDISNCVQHGLYFFGFGQSMFESVQTDIKNAKVVFDIGAHIGTTSIILSRMNPSAKIYAFEPHPVTFIKASDIFNNNIFKNINCYNLGLGDKPGKLKLYEVNVHNSGMNRILHGHHDYPFAEVDITTIDEFVFENNIKTIDFIKIDVEGFEYAVLKGGENSLRKFQPVLFIELDDNNLKDCGQSASALLSFLFSLGYKSVVRADTLQVLNEKSNFAVCHFDILVK